MFDISQKKQTNNMLASCAIALFAVLFLWNFWQRGARALGINFFFFLFFIFLLFNWQELKGKKFFNRCNMICQLPIFLIILSFLIYENPFIKIVNLFVLPLLFAVFYNYARLDDNVNKYWGFNFLNELIIRIFSFLVCIKKAVRLYLEILLPKSGNKRNIAKILIGVLLFLALAVAVIIPLLSSADREFASKINFFYLWIKNLIALSAVMKFIVSCLLSVFTSASLFLVFSAAWRMALYVIYYGFSYEKFFASYAVLFCVILFCWLIFKLFGKFKIDIVKFALFLFLWMYGIIAIFPIEQFILRINMELSKRADSRIDLYEMTMLSSDVFNLAKENNFEWGDWFSRQTSVIESKNWYEFNLTNFLVKK